MAHAGSWFNLPDFGITEKIGSALGRPTTSQGGSNIFGPNNASTGNNSSNSGSVQGSSTSPGGMYPQKPSGGGYVAPSNPVINPGGNNENNQPQEDPYARIKNEISSAWDGYLNSINEIGNTYLPQQADAQRGTVNSQYDQGINTVNTQKAASLRDIADNVRNSFQAGNVYLGSRGAGDSSAANQYSFAIGKEANKQTANLNEFVNTQINDLTSQRDQQLNSIASWLAEQQQAVRQAVASGQLSKQQDINNLSRSILDRALASADAIKQNAMNRQNALFEWAASNSSNIAQLKQNIASLPQDIGQPQVDSRGNFVVPIGYGNDNTQQQPQSIFAQNPSWL